MCSGVYFGEVDKSGAGPGPGPGPGAPAGPAPCGPCPGDSRSHKLTPDPEAPARTRPAAKGLVKWSKSKS